MLRFLTSLFVAAMCSFSFAVALSANDGYGLQLDSKDGKVMALQKGLLRTDIEGYEDIKLRDMRLLNAQGRVVQGKEIIDTFRRETPIRITIDAKRVIVVQALK